MNSLERHIIGAMFLDASLEASKLVTANDFEDSRHALIFNSCLRLALAGKSTDIVSVSQELKDSGSHVQAGGDHYLLEISSEVVTTAYLVDHAKKVRELAARRKAKLLLNEKAKEVESGEMPLAKFLSELETGIAEIRSSGEMAFGLRVVKKPEWKSLALDSYNEKIYHGESTGWKGIDGLLRIAPGQLNVVTGVPNHGKSEWVDALMVNLAMKSNWRIAFLSPENSPLRRHIQKLAEKLTGKRLYGQSRMTFQEYQEVIDGFLSEHFEFMDQGLNGTSIDQVLNEARRLSPAINALVIDPWNRLERSRKDGQNETDYICECLTRASRFAQSTGISVWIIAHPKQLRRNKDGEEQKPGLYDISGSAHWNNITDNGIMVWRNFAEKKIEIHVLKVRFKDNGTPGMATQLYEMESGRFRDETDHDAMYPQSEDKIW